MKGVGVEIFVYCWGILLGEWLDGSVFNGICFIDWFEIEVGKIM